MSARKHRSLYDILNVSIDAEPVVIEAAYRALIKKYHPDQAEGGAVPRDSADINAAYSVLRDGARRAEYDHREWVRQQAMPIVQAPLPRARLGAAGVGGWIVAAGLGCGIGLSLAGSSSIATPTEPRPGLAAKNSKAAAAPSVRSPEEAVAEFVARHRLREPAGERKPSPYEAATEVAIAAPAIRPEAARVRVRLQEEESVAPARRPQDQDFLDREGLIY
ncbi:J domain-containing protein [Allosphingosinicella sp.]|uniref:J domain-containing protein n=1 Tax=Allosphingosinicella sp. TaxID=2823234 RepID=UPI002EEC5E35